ncbi:hypothetical protein FA09DRAFT_336167 [Tilletiopsis washingtonensis]|uniref:Uncharacterized protein n=1 Tax=Tilletiopsis washingtonensis TaxID=58919 RepID=A0A316ZGW8_9BASI|nr:hypothetical protein FA09DRAFT_336167 [Tilletiopsis washingtonensis]PWO00762.1 hypothetical protein FA09DRAFT_336167 [Tilletiopsis washingtonensis]
MSHLTLSVKPSTPKTILTVTMSWSASSFSLASDVQRSGSFFVLATVYIWSHICERDVLEEFGLFESSGPAAHARCESPPPASIVELEELQAADSAAGNDAAPTSEQQGVSVAEHSVPSQDSECDGNMGAASGHAVPVPASRLGQRLATLDRQYLKKAGVRRLKEYIELAAQEGCRIQWLHGERVGTI